MRDFLLTGDSFSQIASSCADFPIFWMLLYRKTVQFLTSPIFDKELFILQGIVLQTG